MGKVINLRKKSYTTPDSLITSNPWEFRRAYWTSKHFIQILRHYWDEIKTQEEKSAKLPPHFVIKDSIADTIHSIYNYRNNTGKMREVYYLAGLIDCMINQTNPLLRTDLIKVMYKKIATLKGILGVNWYGQMDQVLLPIDNLFFNQQEYRDRVSKAITIKGLYRIIREGTHEMFDILSSKYIFFTPGGGYNNGG
ncbi:hypothetical protein OAC89_05170 [Deltaproteobacteria bacterium]|nr:hypothetical protein [Deltaproteobacteria bacterium]